MRKTSSIKRSRRTSGSVFLTPEEIRSLGCLVYYLCKTHNFSFLHTHGTVLQCTSFHPTWSVEAQTKEQADRKIKIWFRHHPQQNSASRACIGGNRFCNQRSKSFWEGSDERSKVRVSDCHHQNSVTMSKIPGRPQKVTEIYYTIRP